MSFSFKHLRYQALGALLALGAFAPSAMAAGNVIAAPGMGRGSSWTVYAFGNAQAVSDAFRALHNFAASGSFASIASMLAVIGIIALGLISGFNGVQAKRLMGYVVGVFLLGYVLFGTTNGGPLVVQVEVIDTVDNTWKAPVTVPAVVGIPAALISTAGHRITQQIEASFPVPDELKMSNGAPFNLASSMISDASRARITEPNLASSLAYYVQDCFTMGVASGSLSAQVLLNSTDFLNDIRYDHDSVMVNTLLDEPVGSANVVTCRKAWSLINGTVNSYTDASSMLSNASAWSRTPALSVVNAAADSTAQWATNNGITNGASMIKQAAMLSAFKGAYRQSSAATGNSDFLTGLALSQAHETQVNGWITSAEVFNRTMGYIFAVLQVFVYAITPLILVAALIPGLGVALLKNFGQILLWMALWQPMLAIVNFIILSMQQAELGGALGGGGAMGFTLTNMGIISEKTANLRAAATFIGTMVPVLTWAMVKGGMDFSRFIGSAMGENLSASAANTMTTGNYSLNQASMDSFTANKHSIASSGAWGSGFSSTDYSTGRKLDGGGTSLLAAGGQQTSMMVGDSTGTNRAGSTNETTNKTQSGGTSLSASNSGGAAESGGIMKNGGQTESSVGGTSAAVSGGANANMDLIRKGSGKADAVPGTNGLMSLGGMGAGAPGGGVGAGEAPGQKGSAPGVMDRLGASATGGITTGTNGQHMVANTAATTGNYGETGNRSRTGSKVDSSSDQASYGKGASEQEGYTHGQTQSIQMGATLADRSDLMRAQMRMDSPAFGTSYMSIVGPQTPSNEIERKANDLMTPNAVPAAAQALESGVDKRMEAQEKEANGLRGGARANYNSYRGEGDKRIQAGSDFVEQAKGAAGTGAVVSAARTMLNESRSVMHDSLPTWATDALGVQQPTKPFAGTMPGSSSGSNGAGNAGSNGPGTGIGPVSGAQLQQAQTAAAALVQGRSNPAGQIAASGDERKNPQEGGQPVAVAQAQSRGNPAGAGAAGSDERKNPQEGAQTVAAAQAQGRGNPAAGAGAAGGDERKNPQEGAQTVAVAQAQGRGNQAGPGAASGDERKSPQEGAQTVAVAQAQGRGTPERPGAAQGDERKNPQDGVQMAAATQASGRGNAAGPGAAGSDERKKTPEEEAQQRATVAAPVVAMAVPQPPQGPQPEANTVGQAPVLVAAAQPAAQETQQPQQPPYQAPNPFSGQSESSGNPQQAQAQVQIAEQRAERMGAQMREADNLLIGADSRPASEHLAIIHEARDITGRA